MSGSVEIEIESLISGAQGLARVGGQVVLCPGVLPGERVLITEPVKSKGAWRGRPLEILRPAAERQEIDCPHFLKCGGCDFLQLAPDKALPLKAQWALSGLAETFNLPINLLASPQTKAYRQRVTLHLDRGPEGHLSLGFYDDKRQLVEFDHCHLFAEDILKLVHLMRPWAASLPPGLAGPEVHILKGLAGEGFLISFLPSSSDAQNFKKKKAQLPAALWAQLPFLGRCLSQHPGLNFGLFAGSPGQLKKIAGDLSAVACAQWPLWSLDIMAGPGAFTQVNPGLNQLLVGEILAEAKSLAPGSALDLYAGLGNIARPLAHNGFAVTAVESAPDALSNFQKGSGEKVYFIPGRVENVLGDLVKKGRRFDFVVLDPPRSGALNLASPLASLGAKKLIYVSCHPAMLLRDLAPLRSLGLRPYRLVALDMFPRTSHVELLVVLSPA